MNDPGRFAARVPRAVARAAPPAAPRPQPHPPANARGRGSRPHPRPKVVGYRPLLVSKLRGLGVSLGLPLARPSFSGPESVFGCEGGVVLFGAAPERNGARLA